jgi:hypothetical protein
MILDPACVMPQKLCPDEFNKIKWLHQMPPNIQILSNNIKFHELLGFWDF